MQLLPVGTGYINKNKFTSRFSTSVTCILVLLTTGYSQVQTKFAQSIEAVNVISHWSLSKDK